MESNFWDRLQAVDRRWLYLILAVAVTIGLYIPVEVPAKPEESSVAVYSGIAGIDKNKTVMIQSDWTLSTRGENLGHLENLFRILMARRQKFVLISMADAQAPQVARDAFDRINRELPEDQRYQLGRDWLYVGFFPNAEGSTQALAINMRNAWAARKAKIQDGSETSVFNTDVLRNVNRVEDLGAVFYVTASATVDIGYQRLSGRVPIFALVTGVVGPGVLPFWRSGQVQGVAVGLKGVYDMELMMAYGVNKTLPGDNKPKVSSGAVEGALEPIEGFDLKVGRGRRYYAALNVALGLMVLAVVVGNIAMYMAKRSHQGGSR